MNLPTHLAVEKWFTEEKDLPSAPNSDVFLVKAIDVKTKEEIYSVAMFSYCPIRKPVDYDEWVMVCGATCFARYSSDNRYNVIAWGRLKLRYKMTDDEDQS